MCIKTHVLLIEIRDSKKAPGKNIHLCHLTHPFCHPSSREKGHSPRCGPSCLCSRSAAPPLSALLWAGGHRSPAPQASPSVASCLPSGSCLGWLLGTLLHVGMSSVQSGSQVCSLSPDGFPEPFSERSLPPEFPQSRCSGWGQAEDQPWGHLYCWDPVTQRPLCSD